MSVEQAHTHLASLLPPDSYYAAHLNLIRLGREVCQARQPRCSTCPVNRWCDYYSAAILV
jgi:endonuclease-3